MQDLKEQFRTQEYRNILFHQKQVLDNSRFLHEPLTFNQEN